MSRIDRLILEEASQQRDGLFTISTIKKKLRRMLPRELLKDDLVSLNFDLIVGSLRKRSYLITSGAVEYMTTQVYKTESYAESCESERWWGDSKELGYTNGQGKLTIEQYRRFRPKAKHVRYPVVFRITEYGRTLLREKSD